MLKWVTSGYLYNNNKGDNYSENNKSKTVIFV